MAELVQFTQIPGWTIKSWAISGTGLIPEDGFVGYGNLVIGLDPERPGACKLAWLNGQGNWCSMSLPFESGSLSGSEVPVYFGSPTPVVCDSVTVTMDGLTITGGLNQFDSDGNAGTFTAEANPGPPPPTEPA